MKISLAVLLVALALAASSQSDCPEIGDQWTVNGGPVTVQCGSGISSPAWWAVGDPCQAEVATTSRLNCTGGSCTVGSAVYESPLSCVVCCTEGSTFTQDRILSCTRINVCPTARVEVQSLARTGSRVEMVTYVTTKPQPLAGSVSVTAQYFVGQGTRMLTVEADEGVYPAPHMSNEYAFIHVIEMPQENTSPEDRVLYMVNLASIPTSDFCSGGGSSPTDFINLIQVNESTTASTPSRPNTTSDGVPTSCKLTPESPGLHIQSLVIGAVIGIVTAGIIAVVAIFLVAIRCMCCCCLQRRRTASEKTHHSSNGGERPLLTVNGTPATTPSSEVQHSLGQTSDSTPASTPTDPQDHLLTQQQSQNSDASPYEEISPQSAILFRQRVVTTVPPVGGAPPRTAPPPPVPSSLVPHPPRIEVSSRKASLLQSSAPGYFGREDVQLYLSKDRNKGDSYV